MLTSAVRCSGPCVHRLARIPLSLSLTMTSTNEVYALSSLASGDDGEAVCYLCLHGWGVNDAGQPLRRDCACRGTDAGFVRLSCLAKHAAFHETKEFSKPWHTCPHCHQYYQNKLSINVATEFVSFVWGQYPDDTERRMEALYIKLCACVLALYPLFIFGCHE